MKVQRTEVVIITLQLFLVKAAMAKIIRGAIGGSMGSAVVGGLEPPYPTSRFVPRGLGGAG